MPLMIEIKSGDKLIINGAVIENTGPNTKLRIHNQAAILRGKEVMSEEDAVTPASHIYFSLQCAYIFPHEKSEYLEMFDRYLDEYLQASPSSASIMDRIIEEVRDDNLYKGLKAVHELFEHEDKLMNLAKEGDEKPANVEQEDAGGEDTTSDSG